MTTLFLDFDGVLHCSEVYRWPERGPMPETGALFAHASALTAALEPFADLQIVLSTTWVSVYGFSATKGRLPAALQQRVVGSTYHRRHTLEWESQTRYQQIKLHVLRRGLGTDWVALDDDEEGWPHDKRHHLVVPSRPEFGVQSTDLARLVERLTELQR